MTTQLTATEIYSLPDEFRNKGELSAWAKMTRPGEHIDSFLEGAFFAAQPDANDDTEKCLFVTDVANGRVLSIAKDGDWQVVHETGSAIHSMRIMPDGSHIAVDYDLGVLQLSKDSSISVISQGLENQPFLGLSDMCVASDGTLWFTDSGRTSLSDPAGRVYCLRPDSELQLVLDCVPYSNGICLSHNEKWIYVAATRANQVWRFAASHADLGTPMVGTYLQLSGGLGPDGLATNALGWLAVAQAQAGVAYVFDDRGDLIFTVRLPKGLWTTSVAFDSDAPEDLYITEAQTGTIFLANLSTTG
ncbi:MAG: SMP-30/gluconolactonase/LRE family protein [Gammaproteobacteria bacterium]|nr:SMP-30/gluconolactonase/LRE family protein [Gammaproteobacteria bacterium]